jgi:hypothetical protein
MAWPPSTEPATCWYTPAKTRLLWWHSSNIHNTRTMSAQKQLYLKCKKKFSIM